ncbi:MAG TPA: carbohydrate ABC transporter permease [Gaiellaceae bacterium]
MSRRGRLLGDAANWIVVLGALAFFLLPVIWIFLTSFKSQGEVFRYPPVFWPKQIDFRHYSEALGGAGGKALKDSLVVASGSTAISLLVGVPTAYSISRFRVGGQHLAFWILSIRMFPPVASAIPFFLLFQKFHMLDTHSALIIAYLTFNVPFVVWFVKGFFDDLPRDLEEAALVDGATRWRAFTGIAVRLAVPGIVTSALLAFVFSWNEFLLALFLTRSQVRTLPVALANLVGGHEILWGEIGALTVIAIIPVVVLALVLQRYVVRGLTFGAVKG